MSDPHTTIDPITLDATDRISLGQLLSTARRDKGMTQRQLETATGIPQGKISRIERGQSHPPVTMVAQIADALGLAMTISFTRPMR